MKQGLNKLVDDVRDIKHTLNQMKSLLMQKQRSSPRRYRYRPRTPPKGQSCYICGDSSHYMRDCPYKIRSSPEGSVGNQSPTRYPPVRQSSRRMSPRSFSLWHPVPDITGYCGDAIAQGIGSFIPKGSQQVGW